MFHAAFCVIAILLLFTICAPLLLVLLFHTYGLPGRIRGANRRANVVYAVFMLAIVGGGAGMGIGVNGVISVFFNESDAKRHETTSNQDLHGGDSTGGMPGLYAGLIGAVGVGVLLDRADKTLRKAKSIAHKLRVRERAEHLSALEPADRSHGLHELEKERDDLQRKIEERLAGRSIPWMNVLSESELLDYLFVSDVLLGVTADPRVGYPDLCYHIPREYRTWDPKGYLKGRWCSLL